MKKIYSGVRGMFDFGPEQSLAFEEVILKAKGIFKIFNYQEIILPILEEKGLFVKGVGEVTDIVERQMFKVEGKDIVLRPEGTAQVIRYYLQNSLHKKGDFYKFFYTGAMFRGERPQKGRLRQFHHIGAEAIGSNSFYLDAEIIFLALKILEAVGISQRQLQINTLGCAKDKIKFSLYLKKSLIHRKKDLCNDCQRRIDKNPLRVLDCKKEQCTNIITNLDLGQKHLCSKCCKEFKNLLLLLDDLGIQYIFSPNMVRGLDYYTHTVFEFTSKDLGSQDAIGAGGRYNNLVKYLGGADTPAIGFALGVERILLALSQEKRKFKEEKIDVFVALADQEFSNLGFNILTQLRESGLACDFDYGSKSLKGQMRVAQKKGAKIAIILAESEIKENMLLLKNMDNATQIKIKKKDLIPEITKIIKI